MKMTVRERALLFFALNPDEQLNTYDVMAKYGLSDRKSVGRALREPVAEGWLSVEICRSSKLATYSAGPLIKG